MNKRSLPYMMSYIVILMSFKTIYSINYVYAPKDPNMLQQRALVASTSRCYLRLISS